MSSSNIPGGGAMQDSLEFIKKMWGGMGVPGMVVPTLSVEEINKKIADIKAVESWLNLNLSMLRTTIQALEVQSATLTALQAMGAVNQADTEGDAAAANPWTMPSGFPFPFMNPSQNTDTPPAAAPQQHEPQPPIVPAAAAASAAPASAGTPNAWWELLQNQFKQAVNSVAATEKTAQSISSAAANGATNSDAKSDAKSGLKAAAKPRSKPAVKPAVRKSGSADDSKKKTATGKPKPAPK